MTKIEILTIARKCQFQAFRYGDRQNSECDLSQDDRIEWQHIAADAITVMHEVRKMPNAPLDTLAAITLSCVEVRDYFANPKRVTLRPKACSEAVSALLSAGNVLEHFANNLEESECPMTSP